ncbi:18798_t:CDS:2, partial [Racocetra fulgida]
MKDRKNYKHNIKFLAGEYYKFSPRSGEKIRPECKFLFLFEKVIRLEERNRQLEKRVSDLEEKSDQKKEKFIVDHVFLI